MKHLSRRLCLLLALLFLFSAAAAALNTSDAVESLDTERPCSLRLTYWGSFAPISELEIMAYRFAEVDRSGNYKPTGAFASYPIRISGISSQLEWGLLTNTLNSYVLADGIAPTAVESTDDDGIASFTDLPAGMYLIRRSMTDVGSGVSGFAPFILSLPELGFDGKWNYDRDALPKPGDVEEEEYGDDDPEDGGGGEDPGRIGYSVLKQWKDNGSELRPAQVTAELFRNGKSVETVTLNAENLWSYQWSSERDGAEWSVVERDVPFGYTVSVEKNQTAFVITNSLDETPGEEEDPGGDTPEPPGGGGGKTPEPPGGDPDVPNTGESANYYLYILLLCGSGLVLLLLGLTGRRKSSDEK